MEATAMTSDQRCVAQSSLLRNLPSAKKQTHWLECDVQPSFETFWWISTLKILPVILAHTQSRWKCINTPTPPHSPQITTQRPLMWRGCRSARRATRSGPRWPRCETSPGAPTTKRVSWRPQMVSFLAGFTKTPSLPDLLLLSVPLLPPTGTGCWHTDPPALPLELSNAFYPVKK